MDNPDKPTAESQRQLWESFNSSVQEFRSNKRLRDEEFQAGLEKLKRNLERLNK